MTENELNEIEARANAATPGKWKHVDMRRHQIICEDKYIGGIEDYENANFITHAREDIPELVAEVRQLKKSNEKVAIKFNAELIAANEALNVASAEVRQLKAERDAIIKTVSKNSHQNCPATSFNCKCQNPKEKDCGDAEECWLEWARNEVGKAKEI